MRVPVIAIFGPTASGKSAVAEALAARIPAELVSADSAQVYRGLPILTNQPAAPTRLVAIWELDHEASVGEYQRLAHEAIDAAIAAGRPPVVVGGTSAVPLIRAGKLRAIVVTGKNRLSLLPDVPTLGEFYPGVAFNNWLGIWAPAGTPEPVLARLHEEINRVLAMPEVGPRISAVGGAEPWITTREEFAAFIPSEFERYGKIVKALGVRID